jgi:hypothetical protein
LRIAPPFSHRRVGGNALPARFGGYGYVPLVAMNPIGFHTSRMSRPRLESALALAAGAPPFLVGWEPQDVTLAALGRDRASLTTHRRAC